MSFPQCFVISLQRSNDRRERIKSEFKRENVAFEFVDAIDALQLPTNLKCVSPTFGLPMVAGDIACTMSHALAMQTMLDLGLNRAIIFEDDAMLAPGFASMTKHAISADLPWDVLKLSGTPLESWRIVADLEALKIVEAPIASLLAQGYAITAEGARKIVPYARKPADIFDHVLQSAWKTGAKIYETQPRLVGQFNGPSTIAGRDAYSRRPTYINAWKRRIWKLQRSLWARRHSRNRLQRATRHS
jgi:glycosyl transferase family 25